ncbi:hypothetical protein B0T26DRAFT_753277 [Lasiosphaeria miniovina]|uniref:Uncharacterized protein n=1 Tax=Lasiosphaeria miniovina TaxID=1954250 RepID=A0AA40DVC8_9PEZI|nr:uncharacterized protein B0T26DRAFT_753277 [Lasiosphaeria miniovina]KAK0713133.1 hypothetical protein B0T26DRAFT_753277 [Lasiosphaeria miniovina]
MDPYEANPENIPANDRYADIPMFGRYAAKPDDFRPDPGHILSTTAESLAAAATYDEDVLDSDAVARDYAYTDANEVKAIALARGALMGVNVRVPCVYFAGKINGHQVLIQERIPGVALCVAWAYLSIRPPVVAPAPAPASCAFPSYVMPDPDPDPVAHRGISAAERDILFSSSEVTRSGNAETEGGGEGEGKLELDAEEDDDDFSLMHSHLTTSNCIVDRGDRLMGLMQGPRRENYAALNLPEDVLQDILYWNDLYDGAV